MWKDIFEFIQFKIEKFNISIGKKVNIKQRDP